MLSCDRTIGLFATYERNYTYLEAKGDVDTEVPTSDDLFSIAGFVLGMPVTREKLEKILKANKLQPLFASGAFGGDIDITSIKVVMKSSRVNISVGVLEADMAYQVIFS